MKKQNPQLLIINKLRIFQVRLIGLEPTRN